MGLGKLYKTVRKLEDTRSILISGINCLHPNGNGDDRVPCFFQDKREPLSIHKLWQAFDEWAGDQEGPIGDCEFFYDRKRINGTDTPMILGMRRDDDIEALHKDKLVLLVRDANSGDETFYIHLKSAMLSYVMQSHADGVGVEKSSLVFLCNGKRIFGNMHAREFDVGHYEVSQ